MGTVSLNPKTTAVLIRKILKAAFPAVKFSVTTSRGSMVSSVRIFWMDGPTTKRVDSLTGFFEMGRFDGMTDSYDYASGADRYMIVNGQTYRSGCKFVFTERRISPALANRCIQQVAAFWGGVEVVPVAVTAYQGFKLEPAIENAPVRADLGGYHNDWQSMIYRAAADRSEFTRSTVEG